MKTGIIAASLKEVGIRLEEKECEKISSNRGNLFGTINQKEVGKPSGQPAEFGESSLIASIIIESERVISVRNRLSSRVVCERKNVTGSLITEVCLGLVNTLLNWFANKQYISYLLSVNVLFNEFTNTVPFIIHKEVIRINLDFRNSNMFFMNFLFQMAAADLFFNIEQL